MTSLQPKTPWIGIAASLVLHAVGFSPVWGATVSWINASGGVWSSPSNWDSGVPGASDDAVITLAGTYTVTLDVNASVASLTLGGASGTQTLSASSRTLTLGGASAVNANGALTLSSSTVGGTGSLTNGGTLTMTGSAMNTALDNEGNLIVRASSTVNGALTTGVGTALRVQGGNLGTGTLTVANGFTNNGTVELTSILGAQAATLVVSSGTLINEAGRAINALAGTGGSRTLTAQIDNRGTLSVGTSLTINKASADHLSSGTIDVSGGNLTLTQTGTTPTFTNSGTLTIAAGRTVSANGGELIHTGTSPSGGGTLSLNSVTATLNSDLSNAGVALSVSSSTVNGPGTLIDAAGQTLDVWSSTVNAPLDNEGILNFQGNSTVNGTLTTGAGTTLRVQGSNFGTGTLTVANGFTNNGTVELTSIAGSQIANLAVTTGTLINAAGRTISALAGTGGTRNLTAELDNRGTLSVNSPLTLSKASADHLNSGTIDVSGGNLTLTQTGTTPTFTSSGTLTIAAVRTMSVTGGTVTNSATGLIRGGGTLDVGGTTFTNAGTISPGVSPAILSVTGNCPFSPTAALEIEIGGHVVGTDYDRLAVSGTASLDGALNVSFLPGFCAAAGDSFRVLTAATRSGTFAGGVHVSGKGNAVLAPHYDATGLTLLTLSNFFTLTASAGSGGTISPSGSVTVNCGGSQAFTITADPCHLITDVVVDGASVGPVSTYDFTNVTADHTISATFARIVYTINASAGPGGSIVPSGAVAVGCDASQGFTITPGGGFQISGVVVDGDSVGAVTAFTFPNVHANHTIAASFADVQPPSVQVIAPNGGETWDATSTRTVRWTATDNASVDSVNVDYSLHGTGGPWLSIQHGVAAVDSVDWTVPDVGTDSALVRVTAFDPASNSAEDLSDAAFRIRGPTGVPIVGQATLSLALAPNPTRGGPVHLRVSLPEAGGAAIEVLAVTGQRVWKSRVLGSSPGQRVVDWSGRDSRGRWVGPGVYIVRLRSPWGEKTTRLILLR
ncbi:MAG: T9SS type A sorting domain-containing protein [bacterium]